MNCGIICGNSGGATAETTATFTDTADTSTAATDNSAVTADTFTDAADTFAVTADTFTDATDNSAVTADTFTDATDTSVTAAAETMNAYQTFKQWLALRLSRRLQFLVSDETAVRAIFKHRKGYDLDLANPKTISEKIQWLKLYDRNPLMTQCSDKFAVREYVARKVGPHILNELHAVFDTAGEIDFDSLPAPSILKVNNGSGANIKIFGGGELDSFRTKRTLKDWMKKNPYIRQREWCYKNIPPRIVCEKFLAVDTLMECKIFCFHGEPRVIQALVNCRENPRKQAAFYDLQWRHLDFYFDNPLAAPLDWQASDISSKVEYFKPPPSLPEMLEVARALSKDFHLARVDLYDFHGKVLFGEITFYPNSGHGKFHPPHWDLKLGEWLKLPAARA